MPTIPVSVDFTAEDHVSSVIDGIINQANKLVSTFDHMSSVLAEVVGVAGGLAAAFGFHHMIEETKEHIALVAKLKVLTGETAESADALSEAFELASIGAEDTTNILGKMSLQALRMEDAMMGMGGPGGGAALTQRIFAHIGVDLRRGIVPSLMKMSELAQKGRIGVQDIRLAFRMPLEQALKFNRLLKEGPEKIREQMEELKRSGTAVTEGDIAAMARMRRSSAEISSAWRRISLVVGKELLPVLADLMEEVAKRIKGWIVPVRDFGRFLSMHLHEAIGLALTLGKIMLANAALMKLTGRGLFGGGGLLAGAAGMVRTGATAAGMAAAGAGAGEMGMWSAALAGGTISLGLLAAAALIATKGLEALATNQGGVRDFLEEQIETLLAALDNLFGGFFSSVTVGNIEEFFGQILPLALSGLVNVITGLVFLFQVALRIVREYTIDMFKAHKSIGTLVAEVGAEIAEKERVRLKDLETRRTAGAEHQLAKQPDFDFRGSHFTITQKFEEGFDPDRIITAFTNDLAALGERGIQSGFQPAYVGSGHQG